MKPASARRGAALGPDLRVVAYEDFFKLSDAPHHWEDRVSEAGRVYSVKVYDREAYCADYMTKSAETGRLVRWAVRLSDGSRVSHDGALRIRNREAWERDIRPRVARLRGERREEAIAEALWELLSPEEREAMVAAVDLDAYADVRGERQALADLSADLRASGSLLALVDADWHRRVRDHYAIRHLGGPQRSEAWASATWGPWLGYYYARLGLPLPADIDPARIVGLRRMEITGKVVPAPWWGALSEYFANARGARLAEAPMVAEVLWHRLGGLPEPLELSDFPPATNLPLRRQALALRNARGLRVDVGFAPPDWRAARTPGFYSDALTEPGFLSSVWNNTRYVRDHKANGRARASRDTKANGAAGAAELFTVESRLGEAPFDATRVARFLRAPDGALRVALVNTATGTEFGSLPLADRSREELARVMAIVKAMQTRMLGSVPPAPAPPRPIWGPGQPDPVRPRSAPVAPAVTAPREARTGGERLRARVEAIRAAAPPAPAAVEVALSPAERRRGYTEAWGKEAATRHRNFVVAYKIVKDDRGVHIEGASPDGKLTGTCDRCGTAISNVYVFADDAGTSLMHVGIDCASKMGVSLEELKKAAAAMRWLETAAERHARQLSRAEAAAMAAAERRANLEANRAFIAELEQMERDPLVTDWERRQVGFAIQRVANQGGQWVEEPQGDSERIASETVQSIRERLALARTSKPVGVVGKPFSKPLRAYRSVIVLEGKGNYGPSYLSFLTDDEGNAYFFKGSKPVARGTTVRATWTVKEHRVSRDGVPETVLQRPRGGVQVWPARHADRNAPTYFYERQVSGEDPEEYERDREEPF